MQNFRQKICSLSISFCGGIVCKLVQSALSNRGGVCLVQLQSDQRRHFNDLANFCTQQLQQQLHSGLLRGRRKCNSYIRKLHTIRTLFASILRNQKWKVDSIGQLSIAEKMFKNGWTQVGCIFLQWQLQLATASAVAAGGGCRTMISRPPWLFCSPGWGSNPRAPGCSWV